MKITLTIKNYRCFADSSPATITLGRDFAAVLGVNNAGKSTLLRFFYEFRNLFQTFSGLRHGDLKNAFHGGQAFSYPGQAVLDSAEVFTNHNGRPLEIHLAIHDSELAPLENVRLADRFVFTVGRAGNVFQARIVADGSGGQINYDRVAEKADPDRPSNPRICFADDRPGAVDVTHCIEASRLLADTLYIGPFRNAINSGGADYFDIKIGYDFIKQWDQQKNGRGKAAAEATHRLEHSIARLFGFDSFQLNAAADKDSLQVFLDRKPYRLTELGAGLSQFIVVLANAAVRRPAYILIDEPELNLHPSLQLDFLTTLGSFARHGVVFATHSYGLARASAEVIYTVLRQAGSGAQVKPLEQTTDLAQLLGELSYGGYTAIGFDRVLLVEGPTELKAVQQLLRLYKKDHKILMLPLGGSSLINGTAQTAAALEELRRITCKISAIVDSEQDAPGPLLSERQAFKELCGRLGINCHVLERRAFENYFTKRAIDAAGLNRFRELGPYEKQKDINPGWGKGTNWRVARELTKAEVDASDLGMFFTRL